MAPRFLVGASSFVQWCPRGVEPKLSSNLPPDGRRTGQQKRRELEMSSESTVGNRGRVRCGFKHGRSLRWSAVLRSGTNDNSSLCQLVNGVRVRDRWHLARGLWGLRYVLCPMGIPCIVIVCTRFYTRCQNSVLHPSTWMKMVMLKSWLGN